MVKDMPIAYSLNESYYKQVRQAYNDRVQAVKAVCPKFTDDQATRLSVLLENVNRYFTEKTQGQYGLLTEATQVSNVAKGIKTQYFDIITAVFPNLIAEELFSVQPLQSKTGQIFYLKYIYGDNKGTIKRGDTIFSSIRGDNQDERYMADYSDRTYTSEFVENEQVLTGTGTAGSVYAFNLDFIPVRPQTINIDLIDNADNSFTLTDRVVTTNTSYPEIGEIVNSTGVKVGSVNYRSGEIVLNSLDRTVKDTDGYASYQYDLEYAPSTIPSIELKVASTIITTRPRKLKGVYSLDAGYDLKMSQGIDIDNALLEAAAQQLKNEVDAELIMTAYAQAAQTISWNNNYDNQHTGISKRDYYEDFIDAIGKGSTLILQKTKRVEANWLVVGKGGADVLAFIGAPRFIASGDNTSIGPRFLGTLDNKWKVYLNPFMPEDDFLLGYKGATLMDAGLIYAPYLLFFATETIMLEDFLGRRGFATTYGKKMINNDLYVRGRITHIVGTGVNAASITENPTGTDNTQIGYVVDGDKKFASEIDNVGKDW